MIQITKEIPVSDIRTVIVNAYMGERVPEIELEERVKDEKSTFVRLQGFDRLVALHQQLSIFLNVVKAFEEKA